MSRVPTFLEDEGFSLPPPKKKSKPTNTQIASLLEEDESSTDGWLHKCKPKEISEIAVHINKVKELENFLLSTNKSNTNNILLITGPSGCGKTTTLETLCKNLRYKIVEWITPSDKFKFESPLFDINLNHVKQFEQFLEKSTRYKSCLNFENSKTLILVKDFPNVFLQQSSKFHEVLENISKKRLNNPLVFICGEDSLRRKLFPSKINCFVSVIRFNPITNLQMLKLLKVIVQKEKLYQVGVCDETLSMIGLSSKGDVRHAVSELYFHCIKSPEKGSVSKPETPEKSKDSHIDFFNGLENVLSPKKLSAKENRVNQFTTSPETLVDNFLSESKDFVHRLCENYPTKLTNIVDLSNVAQRLATSDILLARWDDSIFKEYALSIAIRGTMVCNKSPTKPKFQFYGKGGTYNIEKQAEALKIEGKSLFPSLHYQCLCDILPYAKCLVKNLNPKQKFFLNKTTFYCK